MSDNHQDHHGSGHSHNEREEPVAVLNSNVSGSITTILSVRGMDCGDEVKVLQETVGPMRGVRSVAANLMAAKFTVTHDETVTPEALIAAIKPTGMDAMIAGGEIKTDLGSNAHRKRMLSVAVSGTLTGLGLILEWIAFGPAALRIAIFAMAIVAGGWFLFPKAVAAVRRFSFDMNLLMMAAVVGAAIIGQWSEGAAVTFLFGLSEMLEAYSLTRARRAVQALMQLTPKTALLKDGQEFREVGVEQVVIGAIIAVKSGSSIPLDGEIVSGQSTVNQAPITGESMPVDKGPGDPVFAGTVNGAGSLEVRITKAHTETTISRIIHLVEEAQSQKAPSQRFVDVFAQYYTPAVMVAALVVMLAPPLLFAGAWPVWFYRGLVLLVIACPCALVISTPVSVVSGLTAMARRGVLIKGGAVLEAVGKIRALAVDKTGTITEGRPRVTKVVALNSKTAAEILRIAAAIDTHSEHPLARAVVTHAKAQGVEFPRCENYQTASGRGAEGLIDGHPYFVGNHRFAHELAVCSPEIEQELAAIEAEAQSVVVVGHKPHDGCAGEVLGILAVGDDIRANAVDAILALQRAGVQKVVMLSGDNQRTASAIAKKAGIQEAHGDLLPEQKIERVKALMREWRHVGMMGDGVNDAPAMAAATVGIAMGGAGSDAAIETANMALMQDDLSKVAEAIALGRRTVRIIQFNIVFSLLLKTVFLVLALLGHTSLRLAILADTGATLLVIANALRLLRAPVSAKE